jgi:hypothetical protein
VEQLRQQQAASADVLHSLWKALENSPLPKALSDPLPFELPPGHGKDDSDSEDEPGTWYQGLEWLESLRRARDIQRHLVKFSHQGDMLFPDEYISHMISREENEWREWEQNRVAASTDVHTIGEEDDDDYDDDDIEDVHHYGSAANPQRPRRSYAAAAASSAKKTRIEDVGALSSTHANQDVMYDESGQSFDIGASFYNPQTIGDYHPSSSQFDSRSGLMTTPGAATSSSSLPVGGSVPSPSSSPNLSAFQSYEGFGGHWAASHSTDRQ